MTTKQWIFCMLCMLTGTTSLFGENLPSYTSSVSNESVKLKEGKVTVSFTLDLGHTIVHTQHKRIITPILCTPDGKHEAAFPPVIASGRNRAIKDLRSDILPGKQRSAYTVLQGNRQANRIIEYQAATDFQPWMEHARFSLREEVIGCTCGGLLETEQNLKEQALYIPQLMLSKQTECPVEFIARREQRDAFLIYPVDKAILYPNLYGNKYELQKIDSSLTYVQRNPAYEIERIEIAGYASPEGNLQHNVKLAEARASALKDYIRKRTNLPESLMTVAPGVENWDGLVKVLKNYQLPYKEELLDVISHISDLDQREEILRKVGDGLPYQTLLHTIYPGLRKNTFTIFYISKERPLEEARELVFTNPGELNVYEFYNVAKTFYSNNHEIYNKVLTVAADTYPQHSIANNNAARIALENGELEKAENYLLHTRNESFTWNNRAYLLWKQGKRSEALIWWQKAAETGDKDAIQNLQELENSGY